MTNFIKSIALVFLSVIFSLLFGQSVKSQAVIDGASAHWISETTVLWDVTDEAAVFELRHSFNGDINIQDGEVSGGEVVRMHPLDSFEDGRADYRRHISGRKSFKPDINREMISKIIQGQIVAIAYNEDAEITEATRVQFPGLIDDLFVYEGTLGPVYHRDSISVSVWAPTAQSVNMLLFDEDKQYIKRLKPTDKNTSYGVWTFTGPADWDRKFYLFEADVYHPLTGQRHLFRVADPYSVSLAMGSRFSQFADLENDPDLKPGGWDNLVKKLPRHVDISVYEIHMRDFSVTDHTVPDVYKGKYRAFTLNGQNGREFSNGMKHLKKLSDAGLTHLHLLPVNDTGSVLEDPSKRVELTNPYEMICDRVKDVLDERCEQFQSKKIVNLFEELAEQDPVTKEIQAPYYDPWPEKGLAYFDAFNWGYDPVHFNVPEGSYSTIPDGAQRILEVREMVMALEEIGLKTVIDVVYNHTFASGTSRYSVLDKIVPGYYHRYNADTGALETSTCCDNTAAEHKMMEKLIIDSVLMWAKHYKIDSFRFDLMGHHPKSVMEKLTNVLASLTPEKDGVDGKGIYIYGEGWNFGEVADNRIFEQATQFNMGGTGIGNFNDRIRDAIRGPFYSWSGRFQGFANGQYLFPNEDASESQEQNLNDLLGHADRIRVGLAGNLSSYPYFNRMGELVDGSHDYIGYTEKPQETVNYIDKHDNETLWDNTQTKLPFDLTMDQRVRVHLLSTALLNFGQGVIFHQLGTDMLRSKSMDRNSYNSGDWFNRVDYTMITHNWGTGLPPGWDNRDNWDEQAEFMQNPNINVQKEHIAFTNKVFREQLEIRYSSPLFRLETAEQINRRVSFHNTGPNQVPGIIAMGISDGGCAGEDLDSKIDGILVLYNSHIEEQAISIDLATDLILHPVLETGSDRVVKDYKIDDGNITIPALSSIVLVSPQGKSQGNFECNLHDH